MKKVTLFIMFFIAGTLLMAQTGIGPLPGTFKLKHPPVERSAYNPASKVPFVDTLLYVWMKTNGNAYWTLNTTTPKLCQYFNAPQAIQVKGANFYAKATTIPSVTVTAELFLAGADSMPTGSALATGTVNVDSSAANGLLQHVLFTIPYTISAPYVIVLSNNTANDVAIVTNSNTLSDGQGENLARIYSFTGWVRTFSYGYDIDWMIEPVVSYSLARVYFTMDKTCINDGDVVNFTNMHPAIYNDRMYDYYEVVDSSKYQFYWNFGDLPGTVNAIDTSHQYATAAAYTITLADFFVGWCFYTNMQDTVNNIDICSGIKTVENAQLSIYPNPAHNFITIENAERAGVEIYNLLGLCVKQVKAAGVSETIDIRDLPAGTYFVRIRNNGDVQTRKIEIRK